MCTKKRRLEWTLRLVMEAKQYPRTDIAWVTLTYNDEHLPRYVDVSRPRSNFLSKPTLWPDHCKMFMKRLRRHLDYKIRFYAVGEYGSLYQRPHLHMIIFGLKPEDWYWIEDIWSKNLEHGFVCVKDFWTETCGYSAGYIQKKLFGGDNYDGRIAPFMRCSLNPAIGEQYFLDNIETICKQGFIKFDKVKCSIPRTFLRKAIAEGLLPENDLDELALIQNVNFCDFMEHLDAQGFSDLSDYEFNYIQLKENEFKRMNVTRNNYDINFGKEVI